MGSYHRFRNFLFIVVVSLSSNVIAVTEDNVQSVLQEAQTFLEHSRTLLQDDSLATKIESLQKEIEGLKTLQDQLQHREQEISRLVALANAKQVEGFMARLNETFVKETTLRKITEKSHKIPTTTKDSKVDFIERNELRSKFNTMKMISDSDFELSEWVLKVAQEELEEYKQNILKSVSNSSKAVHATCPAVMEIVQEVQAELTKFSQDVIGKIDHAQGGEIVHTMTSPTYQPPPMETQLLGNVWWRKFIPEDWENLLPQGWESWNVGLPAFVYHTLNLKRWTKTAPPETILEKKVQPGSCWPMDGNRGHVTIRLPYPIKLESFSLDHVSWNILPEDAHTSAPKRLKVIAYPPCPDDDDCGALGFDFLDSMEVAHFEYKVDGPAVQTFDSIFVQAAKPQSTNDDDDDGDDDNLGIELDDGESDDLASCSQEAAACSTPPEIDVAAITIHILENHGNTDYTCLYRFRVHGEQVL